jgi:Caspase domain
MVQAFHHWRLFVVCGIFIVTAAGAEPGSPVPVENASAIHALIIGIDAYHHVTPLKGAGADARDIKTSLRRIGVADITLLVDEEAYRESILRAADSLRSRLRPGDLVILSIAGHGAQEPERIRGSEQDGKDTVFLLAGFDRAGEGTKQRILDKEFNHLIKSFEAAGARVLFVADTCSGGGLAREVDPRAAEMSYRSVPAYKITDDQLDPITTPADAFATVLNFDRTIFLAAADKNSKAPEITVPGIDGYRGALSYALARALDGAADADGNGDITVKELFDYVHQVTYQLSDQRQNIVSATAPNLDVATEAVLSRSVTILNPPDVSLAHPAAPQPRDAAQTWGLSLPLSPVRIAALGNNNARLAGLTSLETKYETVPSTQYPELLWDAQSGDVISGGDVVARRANKADLPAIIDRAATVRALKQIAARSVQPLRLIPDARLHHGGTQVEVEVDQLEDRALLLFNIAGDGTVQLLYPHNESDARMVDRSKYRIQISVVRPYGADQIVAVTTPHYLSELEMALKKLDKRRTSGQIIKLLSRYAEDRMRLGTIGVFTAP